MPFFIITRDERARGNGNKLGTAFDVVDEPFETPEAAEAAARERYVDVPHMIVEEVGRSATAWRLDGPIENPGTDAFPREEPGKAVFEGDVLEIQHDWGVDYDV